MKFIRKPAAFLLIFFFFLIWLLLSGCDLLWFYDKEWTLSGEAQFTNSNVGTNNVKFAAFYIDSPGGNLTPARDCVSNVANLGSSLGIPVIFSLDIDMYAYDPDDGDEVHLYMWEDSGGTKDVYESGEDKSICVPNAGCPVFSSSSLAVFFFISGNEDYDDGWYLNAPGGITAVEDATLTGALIINNSSL